jgi:hypothetical protein
MLGLGWVSPQPSKTLALTTLIAEAESIYRSGGRIHGIRRWTRPGTDERHPARRRSGSATIL